jgi:hypothetical protein
MHAYPCSVVICRLSSRFDSPGLISNTLVNVYPIADALFTATETHVIHRIDKETLNTLDTVSDF